MSTGRPSGQFSPVRQQVADPGDRFAPAAGRTLKLSTQPTGREGLYRVTCEGPLSLRSAAPGTDPLEELLGQRAYSAAVVMSFEQVIGGETSGIAWLFRTGERFAASNGKLVLLHIPLSLRVVIDLFQLQAPFRIALTESEAIAMAVG